MKRKRTLQEDMQEVHDLGAQIGHIIWSAFKQDIHEIISVLRRWIGKAE